MWERTKTLQKKKREKKKDRKEVQHRKTHITYKSGGCCSMKLVLVKHTCKYMCFTYIHIQTFIHITHTHTHTHTHTEFFLSSTTKYPQRPEEGV